MKDKLRPSKVFAYGLLAFVYVVLTVCTLFIVVPQMLREADTVVNLLALVAIAAWAFVTYCLWFHILKRKPTRKKGTRR